MEKPSNRTMTTPATAEPKTAPRRPPVALPIIEAVPISKKAVIVNGAITNGKILKTTDNTIIMVDVIIETIKPMIKALGAYGNNSGQSSTASSTPTDREKATKVKKPE